MDPAAAAAAATAATRYVHVKKGMIGVFITRTWISGSQGDRDRDVWGVVLPRFPSPRRLMAVLGREDMVFVVEVR